MKNLILLIFMTAYAPFAVAQNQTIGKLVSLDPAFDALIDPTAKIEVLADGFKWSEGPAWVKEGGYLIFSDVPQNTIFKWKEGEGLTTFLKPSGYTGRGTYSREPGSNGLTMSNDGRIIACEHGDRRVSIMPTEGGGKLTLADRHAGKRFNSPNDVVQKSDGTIYFTDPPYGLPKHENDRSRETPVFGVYRIASNGRTALLINDLQRPNGLAFSPDEKILYVAQSDPKMPYIMAYPVKKDGLLGKGKLFFDASELSKQGLRGLPDGLRVDVKGNIFTTGPGGVLVISPDGKLLGRIDTTQPTANCAWGDDGSMLYITANNFLCRIKTKTKAAKY
jgi:gluconolactonase